MAADAVNNNADVSVPEFSDANANVVVPQPDFSSAPNVSHVVIGSTNFTTSFTSSLAFRMKE